MALTTFDSDFLPPHRHQPYRRLFILVRGVYYRILLVMISCFTFFIFNISSSLLLFPEYINISKKWRLGFSLFLFSMLRHCTEGISMKT
jgi:inner membrane protein involved in colicin E2 resistance